MEKIMMCFLMLIMLLINTEKMQPQELSWESVKIYPIKSRNIRYEICAGEWFVKAKAKNIQQLNSIERKRIKKSAFEKGCLAVMVDVYHKYSNDKSEIYVLGIVKK